MKILDNTPFYKDGQLSLIDRGKAMMQFGAGWIKEIEAQKSVVAVMERMLDKKYTVLINIAPPGMDATIPLVLVGPTGVFVMWVTPLVGMYRAKGDQWGSISGNAFKPGKPNLLTRTERMARAVQVFLQRQGYADLPGVEAVLLCSDPSIHIDSLRPIVRVVMRDALERFLVSITQGRVVLTPENVFDVVNRLQNQPAAGVSSAAETMPGGEAVAAPIQQQESPYASPYSFEEPQETPSYTPSTVESPFASGPFAQESPVSDAQARQPARPRRRGFTRGQWIFLVAMFAFWCLIVAVFILLAIYPGLLP